MLSEEERREIEEELPRYETRRAVGVEALKIVQRRRGWVDSEALGDVAEFLGMTRDELDHAATFYRMIFRKPVGRHVILFCDSVTCWIQGCEHLAGRLGIRPGETTADGRFTLLSISCLGMCDHAPAVMIDEDTYGDLTPEKLDDLLTKYV